MAEKNLLNSIIIKVKAKCERNVRKDNGFMRSNVISAITKKIAIYIVVALICIIVICPVSCKHQKQKTSFPPAEPVTNEEYNAYSDLLLQLYEGSIDKGLMVIRDLTRLNRDVSASGKYLKSLKSYFKKEFGDAINDELIESFIGANAESQILEDKFEDSLKIVILSKKKEAEIFEPGENGWERFYLEYPKPSYIIELSRVAFNKDGTKAILYHGSYGDSGKGGIGYYILLEKVDSKWVIVKKIMAWIA